MKNNLKKVLDLASVLFLSIIMPVILYFLAFSYHDEKSCCNTIAINEGTEPYLILNNGDVVLSGEVNIKFSDSLYEIRPSLVAENEINRLYCPDSSSYFRNMFISYDSDTDVVVYGRMFLEDSIIDKKYSMKLYFSPNNTNGNCVVKELKEIEEKLKSTASI